jgi:mannonate dehydratase
MNRRDLLKRLGGGAGAATAALGGGEAFWQMFGNPEPIEAAQAAVRRGLPAVRITDVKVILSQVGGAQFCNVKVMTDEPGLYGVGDGNHAERVSIVGQTIDEFLKPLVVGRRVDEIEDIWQTLWVAPYWRHDIDANNAMAAIDGALWDIMGKRAGMPVYQLLGGKLRPGCRMFANAGGQSLQQLEDNCRALMAQGYQHIRLRGLGGGGGDGDGGGRAGGAAGRGAGAGGRGGGAGGRGAGAGRAGGPPAAPTSGAPGGTRRNDAVFVNGVVQEFEHLRKTIGFDLELGYDVHEYPHPTGALLLAKALEPTRPFFIEDLFAPEDVYWYQKVREETSIGIAMGELFVNRAEWLPLVKNRWIDFFRGHISAMGGLNMARKIAKVCEFYNVRTSWHGPNNVSPIGHAINLHIDLSAYNFGIGEGDNFSDQIKELFPGVPEIRNAIRYPNDLPGLGVDINETIAAKYPLTAPGSNRGARGEDGEPRRP